MMNQQPKTSKLRFSQILFVGMMLAFSLNTFSIFVFESSCNTNVPDLGSIALSHPIPSTDLLHAVSSINSTKNTTTNELRLETKIGPKPYVVCTYLRGNAHKYIIGTIVLMESVQNYTRGETFNPTTTPEIRTAVVCHESVQNSTRIILELLGHDVIIVQDAEFNDSSVPSNHFQHMIQKYVAFELTQYQTALFIDSDAFVLKPEELRGIFGLLDEEGSQIEGPNAKPASIKWSRFKQLNISSSYENTDSNVPATKAKVMMSLDFGKDDFNSGVILYKPSTTLFRDFREFLSKIILPLPEHLRKQMVQSTQRLLQEFLFSPSSHYELYSLCGKTPPHQCMGKDGCYCRTHVYPQLHDCNKDKLFLQYSATIVHFAGGAIDYDALCDPNTSPSNLEQTIQNYFAKSRNIHASNADYDFECHRPIIQNLRDHYSSALHRIGM